MFDRLRTHRSKAASSQAQSIFRRASPHLESSSDTDQSADQSKAQPKALRQSPLSYNFSQIPLHPQAKLTVSQPSDPAEQEADRVADQVMRMEMPESTGQLALRSIQRSVQRKCETCEAEESPGVSVNQALQSGGQPLDLAARSFMEPRFGHDFSQVRIHRDTPASQSAQKLNARAYTVGQDVVFGAGQYAPDTDTGKHLLAHELTHVVQQHSLGEAIAPSLDSQLIQRQAVTEEDDRDLEAEAGSEAVAQPADLESPAQSEAAEPVVETEEGTNQAETPDSEAEVDSADSHANSDIGSDIGSDESSDADTEAIEPLPNLAGEGEPFELVAYANSVRLKGRTNASFSNSFTTKGITTEPGTGCPKCGKKSCVHATGTVESTFSVNTTVTLPRVSNFPKLTPCQKDKVKDGIDNVLAPHEQEHVKAFHAYDGTVSTPFDLTICRKNFDAQIQSIHNTLQRTRRTAAKSASAALDPFQFDVDLDCTE